MKLTLNKQAAKLKQPARRKRRSREEILSRIFRAASDEFHANGYVGATTAAIAAKADVTEAQLFRYFATKQALFREVVFEPLDQHFSCFVGEHAARGLDVVDNAELTRLYVAELNKFISENAGMLMSLVIAQAYDSGAAQGIGEIKSLRTYFDHGATTLGKSNKAPAHVDTQLLVRISFATVLACALFKGWVFPKDIAGDDEITAAVNHFIVSAITANS